MARLSIALTVLVLSLPAFAAEDEAKGGSGGDPMAAWKPAKVSHEAQDRKAIEALLKTLDDAGKKGDLDAAAAHIDFPVLMVTDDSKGQAMGETWTKEQWTKVMQPFYAHPTADMRITHKYTIFLVSDSLANVGDQWSMQMGPKKLAARSSSIVIKKDGKWLVKSMMEGGWGDVPMGGQSAQGETPGQQGGGAPVK